MLSLILAVILMIGLLPISAFATSASAQAGEDKAATQDSEFLRIFHLDCGRKYFTVSEIEGIIDQLAENHYTHIQLAFGNDGLRFLLNDMSLTVNGTEYDSKKVTTAIKNGNSSYNSDTSAASGELNQGDMDAIIKYANDKGIQVIPMFNAPGHMYTVVKAKSELEMGNDYKNVETYGQGKSPNWAIKPTDETAVAFAEALLQKYAAYFASKGSTMFNVGADESGLSSDNYLAYAKMVNAMNKIVKSEGMKTLAYNDGIYHTSYSSALKGKGENGADFTFDTDIIICYWTDGANLATVETLLDKGFKVLNNTNDWYYVLGDFLFQIWAGGQWGYEDALKGIKSTPVTRMKDGKDYVNSKQLLGSILCVWCDGPKVDYYAKGHEATSQTNQQSVYNLIKAMAEYNPDYFTGKVKLSASDDATGVSVAVTGAKGQKATVEVKKITSDFTFDTEAHVSYNVTPAVDGKAYTGEGTVTLPVPEGWATEASRIHAYIIDNGAVKLISGTLSGGKYTFQVPHFSEMGLVQLAKGAPSKTENITLTVGGTKTVSVDGIQEIVTAPNGQYATATTTTIPAEPVSYMATASASIGAYESYNSSNLIDGSASTFYWSKSAQTVGAYAQVDLGAAIPFDTVRITSPSNVGDDYCVNAAVQVSVDRSEWTDIGSYTGNKTAAQSFANTLGSARYIRVLIKNARGNWWKLAEIEWGNTQNGQFTRMAASGTVTVPERTSISFTGVAVGNTTAVIGDTQYNITVNGRVEIPISIIDYRADGLLFDWSYYPKNQGGQYYDSYRYGLVHSYAYDWGTGNGNGVNANTNADGNLEVSGTADGVEKIEGTLIQRTGNANTSTKFFPNGTDNDWSRAGLVETNLGTNGMPVYTDAAVRYVASLLKAGYYNNVSDSAYNCNSYIYKTFVAADGKRSIHNTSTTAFSAQFEVTKSYNDIKTAYDLAWYLLNTIYQPDTEATVPVTDVNGQQREVPLYGMAVDTYKSIVLTDGGNGKYTFEAGYESNKVEYPRNVNFDRENGKIYNGGDEKNLGFYPLEGLGYEQNDLLENTSFTDSKHRNGGFTLRGESQFVYNEGANLYFTFTGDDDVYMYINGVLALDLGGAHGRNTKTVKLDSLDKDTYKLKDGEVATFTFFYMERCSDASTFGIETNMKLVQRDIAVEKNAYSDSQYTRPVNSGAVVDNGRDLFYDLVVTNKGNTVMTNFTFEDTDSFTGKANLGFDVTDASVTAGSGQVSLSANGYTCFVTDADGNQVGETKTVASLEELSTAVAGVKLAANQSLHVRFLKATVDVAPSKIISYTNTIKVTASAGGARLWGDGSHSIYAYNDGGTARTYVVDFGLPLKIEKIFDPSAKNYIDNASGTIALNGQPKYGTAELTAAGYGSSVVYRLNAHTTIDGQDTITLNVPYKFDDAERTLPKTLNIIPASNVYYEDSLAAFTDGKGAAQNAVWSTVGNDDKAPTEQTDVYQALEELGKHSNVYGHDGAYDNSSMLSMGTAHKVTVTAAMLEAYNGGNKDNFAWPTAQFTFKGTGFDIISLTDNSSGAIMVTVEGVTDTTYKKNFLVNNYYGYAYDKDKNEWVTVASGDSNAIYQIPVMKVNGIPYGEYKVTIGVLYNSLFDKTGNSAYSFWLDAVRIYDPMGEYTGYTQDNEGYPQYIKLHDEVVSNDVTVTNALFIDGEKNATIQQYTNLGPNNEVYLMKGQAITFKLTGDTGKIASVQIGAKAPKGTVELKVNDSVVVEKLSTATEMYYDITTQATGGSSQVTITNTTGNILSLTNLKITFKEKPTGEITLAALNTQEQESAVSLVRALFTAPVATFSPETFEADWGRAVRAGKRATLTVKTSADVESITVDGQAITSYTTRTQRTGWGWWSPKVTYHVFTYTITAPAQTTDYAVCAVNAEGTASEAVTATLTVKPTTWWNWWF